MTGTSEYTIVDFSEIETETEKAYLISVSAGGSWQELWVPKSIVGDMEWKTETIGGVEIKSGGTMELPNWFLDNNGI